MLECMYIVRNFQENQTKWPSISTVGIGQVCAHSTDEVACELLFSNTNHVATAKRAQTKIGM